MTGKILYYLGKLLAALIGLLVGVIVLIAFSPAWVGIGLLGVQILFWLNTGAWPSFRLTDAIDMIAVDLGYIDQLKDLHGVGESFQNLLNLIPLSAFLIFTGLLLSAAVAYIYDGLRERVRGVKEQPSESDFVPVHVLSTATCPLIQYSVQGEDQVPPLRINEPYSNPLAQNQASPARKLDTPQLT
jgi:hypothetical protein